MRAILILLLVALAAYGPRLGVEDWQGTEGRRVQVATEMQQSGDYLIPTLGHETTFSKPPLQYWILAGLLELDAGPTLLRLPSVLALWWLAAAAFMALRRASGDLAAWFGGLGILLSPVVLWHFPSAEIDPLFTALTGVSIIWLAEGASYEQRHKLILGGLVGGLAMLAKGPVYLLFLAGTALVWFRRRQLHGVLWFAAPLILVPLAWGLPVYFSADWAEVSEQGAREGAQRLWFLNSWSEIWVSLVDLPQFLLRVAVMLMPLGWWTFHEFRGDRGAREAVLGRDEALLRMCAGAMVSAVFLLLLFQSRPTRYVMPGVPLYLVAVSPAVAAYAHTGVHASRVLAKLVRAVGALSCVALLVVPWLPTSTLRPFHQLTPLLLLGLALAPIWVRTRRQVTFYVLVLPLLAAWTVFCDHGSRHTTPPRSYRQAAEILGDHIERLGAGGFETRGHIPSQILLELEPRLGAIPRGDEYLGREPTARWLLVEDPDRSVLFDASKTPGYRNRVHLRLRSKTIVLKERQ